MLPLSLSSISCLQCSSLYEQDCANPVASQRFHYPCLDSWASTSCLIVEDRGILVRNAVRLNIETVVATGGNKRFVPVPNPNATAPQQRRQLSASSSSSSSYPSYSRMSALILLLF